MRAGKLNHLVTIQQANSVQDEIGQPIKTWADVATVWASIEDLTGREYQAAQATQNPVQTRIRIRYRPDVVAEMRVMHGADVYNIQAVLDRDGARQELQLMCVKGLSNG